MDEYNRLIDQYNQQAQQVINNSNAAIGNQASNVPTTSIPSGTTTTTPTNTQPTTTGNTAQQTAASMQQGVNNAQQDVNNAQQGVVNATQQAIASSTGGTGATQTQTDAWTEWNTLTAKAQNGTATPTDYARAQQLYPLLFGGSAQTPTTGSTTQPASTQAGTGAGTGTGTTGTQDTGATPQPTGTNTQTDALAEWNAIMARVQAGTATPADYSRAQELYSLVYGGTPASTSGTNQGNQNTPQSQSGMTTDQAWAEFRRLIALGTPDAYIQAMALYNSGALNGVPGYTGATSSTGVNTETPATYPSGNPVVPGVTTEYEPVQMDNLQRIRDMYDAQINAERIALQEQGDQALSDAQANRDKIADTYAKQRNSASVDWERQRRNFLEGAMTSGLNTGAGSQAELSMMGMYQRGQNTLGASQAQAEAEADRNIADIRRSTQASINEAVMKNDYQKAAALLDEYKDQYNRAMDRAEALASFGDFSGYAALYGQETASNMFRTWAMQNPELALSLGLITQQQFAQGYLGNLYKSYPALALYGAGYGGTGGGGYSGGDYSGSGDSGTTDGSSSSASSGSGSSYPSAAQLGQMSPASYAAYVNGLVASGQLDGATGQALIRESYAYVP